MSNSKKIIIITLILLAALQLAAVKLARAGSLPYNLSYFIAKIYSLKAGEIEDHKRSYEVKLADYLHHQNFLQQNIDKQGFSQADLDLKELAWQRTVKDNWLKYFAEDYNLTATDEEINEYMISLLGEDQDFNKFAKEEYDLSWEEFKKYFIIPAILEAKAHIYLVENFNDFNGINLAQAAYDDLVKGEDFDAVAIKYMPEGNYTGESLWLNQEDLVDFYEPIKELKTNEFSRIVMTPNGYVIWKLLSIAQDEGGQAYQVKSLFIPAKSMEEFFQDYLKAIKINKKI